MRAGFLAEGKKGKKRVAVSEDISKLFPRGGKKFCTQGKKRVSTWTHRFVCLCNHDQTGIPTTAWEKDTLLAAGLGEKKVVFEDVDCDAEVFRRVLLDTFPKLANAGGYQLCKCRPNTRELEPLSVVSLSSPRALQGCGGNSRTYIRPLQKDLDLDKADFDDVSSIIIMIASFFLQMMEKCLSCGVIMPLDELQNHVDMCKDKWYL